MPQCEQHTKICSVRSDPARSGLIWFNLVFLPIACKNAPSMSVDVKHNNYLLTVYTSTVIIATD